jgi:hypothetical protein
LDVTDLLFVSLPAPFDWLDLGLLMGPLGLILIGVGMTALSRAEDGGSDL